MITFDSSKDELHAGSSPKMSLSQIDNIAMSGQNVPGASTVLPPIYHGRNKYNPSIGKSIDLSNPMEQIKLLSMATHNYQTQLRQSLDSGRNVKGQAWRSHVNAVKKYKQIPIYASGSDDDQ